MELQHRPWAHSFETLDSILTVFPFPYLLCNTLLFSAKHQISLSWRWSLANKMVVGKDWEKKSNLWTQRLRLLPVLCGSCVECGNNILILDGDVYIWSCPDPNASCIVIWSGRMYVSVMDEWIGLRREGEGWKMENKSESEIMNIDEGSWPCSPRLLLLLPFKNTI